MMTVHELNELNELRRRHVTFPGAVVSCRVDNRSQGVVAVGQWRVKTNTSARWPPQDLLRGETDDRRRGI